MHWKPDRLTLTGMSINLNLDVVYATMHIIAILKLENIFVELICHCQYSDE